VKEVSIITPRVSFQSLRQAELSSEQLDRVR
jgi:hypothetical protein